jgi:hypothetical protein
MLFAIVRASALVHPLGAERLHLRDNVVFYLLSGLGQDSSGRKGRRRLLY